MIRRRLSALIGHFRNQSSGVQSATIAVVVGISSGLAAVGLTFGLEKIERLSLRQQLFSVWIFPLIGIPLTVLILKSIFRDYGGHGVPEVILSVNVKGGKLRARSGISRLIGNMITIASGGSAGPEAPVVISGASIGSEISRWFASNEAVRVAVTGSGAAAAIASIFNAPITGIVFTLEVILADWSSRTMLPVALASVTGTVVSRLLKGNRIPFAHQQFAIGLNDIVIAMLFSLLLAVVSIVFMRSMRWVRKQLKKTFVNDYFRAAGSGALLIILIHFFPQVRGEGYSVVRALISDKLNIPLGLLLALVLAKALATAVTLGGGGEGGVFAPSLVIGALSGSFFHKLVGSVLPQLTLSSAGLFSLVGMAGMISGLMQAPLSGMFLIFEITGGYEAILPLLVVSSLTPMLVRISEKHSIYHRDLAGDGLLRPPRSDARILSDIRLDEILETDILGIPPDSTLRQLIPLIQRSRRNLFHVVDPGNGRFLGLVDFHQVKEFIFDEQLAGAVLIEEVMDRSPETVDSREEMVAITQRFNRPGVWNLVVVDDGRFVGLISKSSLLDHYRNELKVQTER